MTRLKAGGLVLLGSVFAVASLCYLMRIGYIVPGVLVFILVVDWLMPLARIALCLGYVSEDD